MCKTYQKIRLLGKGGMSQVWLVEHLETKKRYACKICKKNDTKSALYASALRLPPPLSRRRKSGTPPADPPPAKRSSGGTHANHRKPRRQSNNTSYALMFKHPVQSERQPA